MSPLSIGSVAPGFTLPADGKASVTLSDHKGKNVVLYFYPKDDTPGCTQEAIDFREAVKEFEKLDTVIFGVSCDSPTKHDKFKSKFCLPFTLVSDEDSSVCKTYGVWVEKSMYGKKYMGIERATYLIDKNGKISNIWRNVKVPGHVQEVLQFIKK